MSYAVLDSGGGRKLERVGPWVVERQAATAWWRPRRTDWRADAVHHRSDRGGGHWERRVPVPDALVVRHEGLDLEVRLTPFGHLGLFAEHASQWSWMEERLRGRHARVLNLFAYTGGATLACARAGAHATHVDAAAGIIDWARRNASLNGIAEVRWITDDAPAFVAREARRGSRYDAVVLDPPSFGRGKRNELWKIEDHLLGLLDGVRAVLSKEPSFVLLSCHTPGYSPIVLRNLLEPLGGRVEEAEMSVVQEDGRRLPAGAFARVSFGG